MSTPTVGLAGAGPATDAVRAALDDVRAETVASDPERVGTADFAVVVAEAGAEAFAAANASARDAGTPWLAVELGGVGGHVLPNLDAAVSGFAPGTACYECLRVRVRANLDGEAGNSTDAGDGTTDADSALGPARARFAGALAGREAATLLAGGESPVLGGVVEIPHTERNLLAVPGCPSCGQENRTGETGHEETSPAEPDRDPALDREYVDADLEDALARAEQAVDDRVGVVSTVGEAESFPAPYYLASLAATAGFSDAAAAEQAAGVAVDWNEALMKALGEGLERYAAGVYRESAFRTARAADLDAAVPPEAFVRPDDWPDTDDAELAWVDGEDLQTGEALDLPAEFVHFPPPEVRHKPSITTGLGLGNSTVEALLSGLYETLERDATMLAWYSTFEPLGLSVGDDQSAGVDQSAGGNQSTGVDQSVEKNQFETLRARARALDLDVTPLLVTQDVDVPVVAAAVHREEGWPRFAVGSDADLDADAAAASALAEALQNWTELRSMGEDDAADADGAIGRYADFPDPAREFVDAGTSVPSDSVGPTDPPDGAAELDALLGRLADADLSAYAARLTPRDVEQLGFEAVRVVVPAAQPLFTGDPFFGARASEVPSELGFEFRPGRDHHPYP